MKREYQLFFLHSARSILAIPTQREYQDSQEKSYKRANMEILSAIFHVSSQNAKKKVISELTWKNGISLIQFSRQLVYNIFPSILRANVKDSRQNFHASSQNAKKKVINELTWKFCPQFSTLAHLQLISLYSTSSPSKDPQYKPYLQQCKIASQEAFFQTYVRFSSAYSS